MTIKQKQCLLAYLGYYAGDIDGIWGRQSRAATEAFQRDYQLTVDGIFGPQTENRIREIIATGEAPGAEDKPEEPENGDFWENIEFFTREEFKCKCGGKYCDGFPVQPNRLLLELADDVREHFGAPMVVSSGIRCEAHNTAVGGAKGSRHKLGKAVDFCIPGKTAAQILAHVTKDSRVRYAHDIDGTYVHMDVE